METLQIEDWKFSLSKPVDPWAPGFDDKDWQDVIAPHDWAVSFPFSKANSSGTGYLPGGTGWYRTHFKVPPSIGKNGTVFINFDGVYKNSQVWCNGYYLGLRPSGYSAFSYDISHCVHPGEDNVIAVKVTHEDIADSRWYTGSGIYRRVTVDFHDTAYIPPRSIVVKTEVNGEKALVRVSAEINSPTPLKKGLLAISLTEKDAINTTGAGSNEAVFSKDVQIDNFTPGDPAGTSRYHLEEEIEVPRPRLWSTESPYLYTLKIEGTVHHADTYISRISPEPLNIGIRTIKFDPDRGFFINGESRKLKGVCVHHDAGCLGAAARPGVWIRRLEKLKAAGCNAIRMSHNPHMAELYDLCDGLGFFVMDEAFDEWEGCKNKWFYGHNVYPPAHQGYYENFPQWRERDLSDMVIRGRNHPSVILWSIGNEIDYPNDPYAHPLFAEMTGNNDANKPKAEMLYNPQKPNMERLAVVAAELVSIVKKHDTTRPVLTAAAFPELSSRLGFLDALDVAGYNYKEQFYEADHKRFPKLPLLGSENGHHLAAWKAARDNDYISGQFLWTGIDYMGEARGWPIRGSGAGILDIAGNEKIAYFRRKSLWNDDKMLYLATCLADAAPDSVDDKATQPRQIQPWELFRSWNYPQGKSVQVICYTNLPQAELFLNGKSLGIKTRDDDREYLSWIIPFSRGCLEARGVGEAGVTVKDALASVLPGVQLQAHVWQPASFTEKTSPDSGAYRFHQIEVELLDEQGRLCTTESPPVQVSLTGPGKLLGLENGDLSDCAEYAAPRRRLYRGRLIAYLLSPSIEGAEKTVVTFSDEGCAEAKITV